MSNSDFIGTNIRYLRLSVNMKQKELAERLGIDCNKLSFYETNRSTPPIEILNKICDEFKVHSDIFFSDIFQGEGSEEEYGENQSDWGIPEDEIFDEAHFPHRLMKSDNEN